MRVDRFDPVPELGWEAMRAEFVHEFRWWTLPEIESATSASATVRFAPRSLAALTRSLLVDGPPVSPIETGV